MKNRPIIAKMVTNRKFSNTNVEMNIVKKNPNKEMTADHFLPIRSNPQIANKSDGNSIKDDIVNVQ